jgi:DNA-binding GntR family transcriptional regulator
MKLAPLVEDTRRSQIVRRMRDQIVSGTVAAGQRLTETDLSEQLGVSRAPLREAIRELVAAGLLVSVPYKGLFVREFTRRDLEELYSLRATLEKMAFREAWDRRTPEALTDLDRRHDALVDATLQGDDPAISIELELVLHNWCYELADHRLLTEMWQNLRPNLQFYFTLHQKAHGRAGPRSDAHRIYVTCAKGDDIGAMLDHLDDHMRQGLERTLALLGTAKADNEAITGAETSKHRTKGSSQ